MVIFSKLGLFNLLFTLSFHELKSNFMICKTKPSGAFYLFSAVHEIVIIH